MHMSTLPFEDFADFIRSQCAISRKKTITAESKFEGDLGVTGDNGVDLLRATEKRFGVQLSDADHGYRSTFDLGPNEVLFHSEGWFPTQGSVREFKVGDLYRAVLKSQNRTVAMTETQQPTSVAQSARSTNWWGLSSTVGLFAWVLFWLKREPRTTIESILCWGTLVAIHFAAVKAVRRRYGWFRHSLATALVKLKVDPKTVQGVLRHEDFGTTMELYAQSDMESMRDAQGKFLEQLMGDRIHLLTERVQ
jgi:acyl carrier protein